MNVRVHKLLFIILKPKITATHQSGLNILQKCAPARVYNAYYIKK